MAISIKYIHDFVFFVVDKTHHSLQRRADIDLAAYHSSLLTFKKYKKEYERTNTISEYMSVFEGIDPYTGVTPNGTYNKPSDYNRYIKITTDSGKSVDIVKSAQWDRKVNHPIKYPTSDFVIARVGNLKLYVLPADTKITLYYFKNPQEPSYKENQSGDYDPTNSIGLEWGMEIWPEIANLILSHLGIQLGEREIVEYTELQKR